MKVKDLIWKLQQLDPHAEVHLDVMDYDCDERIVKHCIAVDEQPGFNAVALHSGEPISHD